MRNKVTAYYKELCQLEGVKPLPLKFCRVGKGGACLTYIGKTPIEIQMDLNRCSDPEMGIIHETAHQILMLKSGDPAQRHNAKFRKIENRLIDKYVYSELTFKHFV